MLPQVLKARMIVPAKAMTAVTTRIKGPKLRNRPKQVNAIRVRRCRQVRRTIHPRNLLADY